MSPAGPGTRPAPRAAFERWKESLVRAGWSAPRSGPRPGTAPAETGTERVPVGEALGRITAAHVLARGQSPRADCAAMDGIAVRAADLAGTAGGTDGGGTDDGTVRLPAGAFHWIDTGDPMPAGADSAGMGEVPVARAARCRVP